MANEKNAWVSGTENEWNINVLFTHCVVPATKQIKWSNVAHTSLQAVEQSAHETASVLLCTVHGPLKSLVARTHSYNL